MSSDRVLTVPEELDRLAKQVTAMEAGQSARLDDREELANAEGRDWDLDLSCQNAAGYISAYGNVIRLLRRRAAELRGGQSDGD